MLCDVSVGHSFLWLNITIPLYRYILFSHLMDTWAVSTLGLYMLSAVLGNTCRVCMYVLHLKDHCHIVCLE